MRSVLGLFGLPLAVAEVRWVREEGSDALREAGKETEATLAEFASEAQGKVDCDRVQRLGERGCERVGAAAAAATRIVLGRPVAA